MIFKDTLSNKQDSIKLLSKNESNAQIKDFIKFEIP